MFKVETNRQDRMIFVRMGGVLSLEEGYACAAAKEAAVDDLGAPYDDHSTLVDIRDLRLQPQQIFAIFTNFVATTKHKSRRIAIVVGEGTARMQFRRVAERAPLRDDMRIFAGFEEALEWLVDQPKEPLRPVLPGDPRTGSAAAIPGPPEVTRPGQIL